MKGFYAAIAVFLVLLIIITCNALFIHRIVKEIDLRLDQLSGQTQTEEALMELEAYWKNCRVKAEMSVPSEVIWEIDDHISELRVAAMQQDEESYATAMQLLKNAVERMHRAERFSLGNLL